MLSEVLAGCVLVAAGALTYARLQRAHLYEALTAGIGELRRAPLALVVPVEGTSLATPDFSGLIVSLDRFLPVETFSTIGNELQQLVVERSFIPVHKKGGTVAYETLLAHTPAIVSLYHDPRFQDFVAGVVGERLVPTPIQDQSSLSLLIYDRPGDHIGWHYDHNFYWGRHFTVLLSLVNEGHASGKLSHATLMAKTRGREISIRTPPNTLVVFEGARILHKVTPILEGEKRIILSMTYCTDPRASVLQGIVRRGKDMAFFGIRSLWT
jgi:hypothetical protein